MGVLLTLILCTAIDEQRSKAWEKNNLVLLLLCYWLAGIIYCFVIGRNTVGQTAPLPPLPPPRRGEAREFC
jgi:hypothetical protein